MKTTKNIIGFLCELDDNRRIYFYPRDKEHKKSTIFIIIHEDENLNIKKLCTSPSKYYKLKKALNG